VVIVGAGWIGCEVACAARAHGARVTLIDPLPQPLYGVLGEQVGAVFRDLHAAHGVQLRLRTAVAGFSGDQHGTVRAVRLADGTELNADVVVVGVGAVPRLELAQRAGLTLSGGGVAVDATLATSHPDIYAAGDIAGHDHPRYAGRVRVEHWANAKDQGSHVAANLLGGNAAYTASPFFFSDQYDLGCEYRGMADPHQDQLVIRGDLAAGEFIAFWLRDGHVMAAMNVNSWDHESSLQALVDARHPAAPDQLRTGDLDQLAHART
jgi:NADPH-dependent 2,4-dienoyl-CoA reductase/sulfur reductase-like enzyme